MIFYDRIRKHNVLDELACQFLFPIDDFISTTDRVPQYFEGLLYRDTPIISVSNSLSYIIIQAQ